MAKVAWKVARKAAGFRMLMDVIPLDATLVKGSHGRAGEAGDDGPLVITAQPASGSADRARSIDVYQMIWNHLTAESTA
jgi:hypothetical protein